MGSLRIEQHLDLSSIRHRKDEVKPEALARGAEVIRAVSAARTPVESGRLVGSAAVTIEHVDGDMAAAITYDGPYARYQHEGLDLRHEHGGQAKFLESALADEGDNALKVIAGDIEAAL